MALRLRSLVGWSFSFNPSNSSLAAGLGAMLINVGAKSICAFSRVCELQLHAAQVWACIRLIRRGTTDLHYCCSVLSEQGM